MHIGDEKRERRGEERRGERRVENHSIHIQICAQHVPAIQCGCCIPGPRWDDRKGERREEQIERRGELKTTEANMQKESREERSE